MPTYQGLLNSNGSPATGTYDLMFQLFDSSSAGNQAGPTSTSSAVWINNQGQFTTTLNFGSNVFNGTQYWLQIGVRSNGAGAFTTLTPRQALTPTPYAIFAETAGNAAGSFGAQTITLDGNLNLPSTTSSVGIIYSGTSSLIQSFGLNNFFRRGRCWEFEADGLREHRAGC
jgi:hypothetical protein